MDEIVKELLEGISEGDYVRVRYGTGENQATAQGTVSKLGEHVLYLRKPDGRPAIIRFDELRSIDYLDSTEPVPGETPYPEPRPQTPVIEQRIETPPPAAGGSITREFVALPSAQAFVYDADACRTQLRELIKKSADRELQNLFSNISSSMDAAVSARSLKDKYHNLRAKLLKAWELCGTETDFEAFYLFLGILALAAERYGDDAIEPLVRAGRYSLAAYAASQGGLPEAAELLTLCALLSGEAKEINQYIAQICIGRRDADVLEDLLQKNKNSADRCEAIASCVYQLYTASRGKVKENITPYISAYDAAVRMLEAIPAEWKSKSSALPLWKEIQGYRYPVKGNGGQGPEDRIGTIIHFDPEKKYGFIEQKRPFDPNNCFFYIAQVLDDSDPGILLRKALQSGEGKALEVVYELGRNPQNGKIAASAIELSDEQFRTLTHRKGKGGGEAAGSMTGQIKRYDQGTMTGEIRTLGAVYRFDAGAVADPWLKACLDHSSGSVLPNVAFDPSPEDAESAVNIVWHNPSKPEQLFYDRYVSSGDKAAWKKRGDKPKDVSELWPEATAYHTFPYVDLAPLDPQAGPTAKVPLTWTPGRFGGRTDETKKTPSPKPAPAPRPVPAPAPAPVPEFEIRELTEEEKRIAEEGHKLKSQDKPEQAAEKFEEALGNGGYDEKVVRDYVDLCLRLEGKIDRAVQLLDAYGAYLPGDKLLNLKISVYDKKKDYAALCPLYEESFATSPTVSRKQHSLFRLIDAYVKQGKYTEALTVCQRWDSFYQQNQYSPDADKMRNAQHSVERQKAICYYHLGEIMEAKRIATDLVRNNPDDAAANSILNDTLLQNDSGEEDFGDDPFISADEGDPQLGRFVQYKIQQTDIASILKSPNIRDGKYVGTAKARQRDIESLVNRDRVSSQTRSDSLFAACKLLEQAEDDPRTTYRKTRYAGRAMAAWGDVMITQATQLDTSRMAYLYALKTLTPNRRGIEQTWTDSYNRYIKSFFLARVGSNSLSEYVNLQNNTGKREAANTEVFLEKNIPDVLMGDFFNGALLLINALEKEERERRSFIRDLFDKNPELRRGVCGQLSAFLGEPVGTEPDREAFCELMLTAAKEQEERVNRMQEALAEVSSVLLLQKEPFSAEQLEKIAPENWSMCLTATDLTRYNAIYHRIIKKSQDFYGSSEFESRSDCLRVILTEVDKLRESILKEPTDISYDKFFPSLEQMSVRIVEKQEELYQSYLPKITLTETIQPFRSPDGQIQLHFTVRNEQNYQAADSFRIVGIFGPDVLRSGESKVIQTLRGGAAEEVNLSVTVSDAANETGSFVTAVRYTYKCSTDPQNFVDMSSKDEKFTFVIKREDFEWLENPFAPFEENIMDNEAMFFGRTALKNQIIDMIRLPDGSMSYHKTIALYGQTRTGKSSLLYHVTNGLKERYGDDILIWDLGNLGDKDVSDAFEKNFIYALLKTGKRSILYNNEVLRRVTEQGLNIPAEEVLKYPESAETIFGDYMAELNRILRELGKIIVLVIDEFTYLHGYIKNGRIPLEFMHFWKAMLQNNCIFAIVAGQDDMPEFTREYPNDFASIQLEKLNYLGETDTKKLIREPLESRNGRKIFLDDDGIDEIYRLTAGSAYLTIILCSKLVDYVNDKGAYTITRGIINDFVSTRVLGPNSFLLDKHFEPQIDERGHEEFHQINADILLSIARLSQTAGYAKLNEITCGDMNAQEIQVYIDRLVDRNVLARVGRDEYRIMVKLLEKWLIDTKGA